MLNPKRIAVFASGTGSNFKAIFNQIINGKINGVIKILISDNSSAKAIEFAKANNINYKVIDKDIIRDSKLNGEFLIEILKIAKIDLIVLAGYLKMIPSNVISSYKNKIINIHPSLLPKFGGKGFYGMKVHRAVIDSKESFAGASVHFVDEVYDNGPIVMQEKIKVLDSDTPESISRKVLEVEHRILPYIVKKICLNEIIFENNLPVIIGDYK
tara:strand:+ start:336 stop:974 length:639 start_codon:yes stop_codon:yes gene_type:complete